MNIRNNVNYISESASELVSVKTVLVVEDDVCCSMALQLLLESYGCKVLSANICSQALELLRKNQNKTDLILLDIILPDKTGIDFLIEANTENILANIPVIVQSAESNETIQKALDLGACGYVHKPYIKEEILRVIKNLTKRNIFSHFKVERVSA